MWDENKVRIIDIAEELGVSTATVSHVIHGKTDRVSKETATLVQKKLVERGYIPNMAATLLAQNNSRIIGVVVNDHSKYEGRVLSDPFVSEALDALSGEIEKAGYFLMLKKARRVREISRFASMWNLDGMILAGFCADDYQELRDAIRVPFVVYDGFFENRGRICNISIDDADGGRQVGEHLKGLGHKKVLFLADNRECMDLRRYQGLCKGLGRKADFLEIPLKKKERLAFYKKQLDFLKKFTAFFAASDFYAAELLRFLQANKIRVPNDASVVGFDGSALCAQTFPTLTSVFQDYAERARVSIERLLLMKGDDAHTENITLPVRLVPGESSAARV